MKLKSLIRMLGPGLLYAGAAVGVSHLVQSTRAGSNFGFDLVLVLIIANILRYPFFEFAPRYASATGKSLVDGYNSISKWALGLFAVLQVSTMFAIQATVTIVTAGIVGYIFKIPLNTIWISSIILAILMIIILFGRYSALDKIIKYVIVILALSTIIAVCFALNLNVEKIPEQLISFDWKNHIHLIFLISFIGWMPAPLDISVWHSLWSVAKTKDLGYKPNLKQSLTDFNIGYIGTAILALFFLTLGALVIYGTGEELSEKGVVFAGQFISMYTKSIGNWSYALVAAAALATMFSTTLTCLDAYPRVLTPTFKILFPKTKKILIQWEVVWMVILVIGTIIILSILASSMQFMVKFATIISFVTAPILAILNYKVITQKHVPIEARPKLWLKILAWFGMIFLSLFSIFYILWLIFPNYFYVILQIS